MLILILLVMLILTTCVILSVGGGQEAKKNKDNFRVAVETYLGGKGYTEKDILKKDITYVGHKPIEYMMSVEFANEQGIYYLYIRPNGEVRQLKAVSSGLARKELNNTDYENLKNYEYITK